MCETFVNAMHQHPAAYSERNKKISFHVFSLTFKTELWRTLVVFVASSRAVLRAGNVTQTRICVHYGCNIFAALATPDSSEVYNTLLYSFSALVTF